MHRQRTAANHLASVGALGFSLLFACERRGRVETVDAPVADAPKSRDTALAADTSGVVATLCDSIAITSTVDRGTAAEFERTRRSVCRTELGHYRIEVVESQWPACKSALAAARPPPNGLDEVMRVSPCSAAIRLRKSEGDACDMNTWCGTLACDARTMKCVTPREEGQDCISDEHCARSLYCKRPLGTPAGTCVRRLPIGASCFDDANVAGLGECEVGAVCVRARCSSAPGVLGDSCFGDDTHACAVDLYCDGSRKCVPALDGGAVCHVEWQCKSRECVGSYDKPHHCL